MVKLKMYFGIETDNGSVVIEKSQQYLEFSEDAIAKAKTIGALQVRSDELQKAANLRDATDKDRSDFLFAFEELKKAKSDVETMLDSAGIIISRFCRPHIVAYLASL